MKPENPFKKIENDNREVPDGLKQRVMEDVANAKIILDLSDLFFGNIPAALQSMFKTNPKDQENI